MNFLARLNLAILLFSLTLDAQNNSNRTQQQLQAAYEAHKSDFDYLLGDWAFNAESKQYGKFEGRWSAVRLTTGEILDEYRIIGDKGETLYVTSTIRSYNAPADRWELIGMGGSGGLQDFGTAQRVNGGMNIEQKFGVASGHSSTWRIRYYNIRADAFSWSADRSADNGQTWTKDFQHIEARRIGPARELGPLATRSH